MGQRGINASLMWASENGIVRVTFCCPSDTNKPLNSLGKFLSNIVYFIFILLLYSYMQCYIILNTIYIIVVLYYTVYAVLLKHVVSWLYKTLQGGLFIDISLSLCFIYNMNSSFRSLDHFMNLVYLVESERSAVQLKPFTRFCFRN